MPSTVSSTLKSLLSPPALAGYAAWGAVWLGTPVQPDGPVPAALVHASLVLFLIVFMGEHFVGHDERPGVIAAIAVTLSVLALVAIAGSRNGLSPILLVLIAALLAAYHDWKPLSLMLGALNLAFVAVMLWTWEISLRGLVIYVLAYVSFQLFAAMMMRAAAHAERMSERLRAANADLIATRGLLAESARDAERVRVARELHDIAGHKLTALKLNLAALVRDARFSEAEPARLCAQLADELLADLRQLVERMRGDEGLDLRAALHALAAPFPRPRAHIEIVGDARVDNLAQAEAVLRAAQEALTNSARHSQAANLWLVLRREPDRLLLDIRDDGRGSGPVVPGNGLAGMRERFGEAGGDLRIERLATGSVHLQAWLPVAA